MTLESLLVSQDAELVSVIRPTLESLSIDVEICPEARAGNEKLISDKFDAVIKSDAERYGKLVKPAN